MTSSSSSSEKASNPSANINLLTQMISQWGLDRKITIHSTPLAQSRKTIEEVHELIEAATRLATLQSLYRELPKVYPLNVPHQDHYADLMGFTEMELMDAIGDVYVTLVMVAETAGLDISLCIRKAFDEIRDRRGYLREDGVFVKEPPATGAPVTDPPTSESLVKLSPEPASFSFEMPFPESPPQDFISVSSPAKQSSPELHDHMENIRKGS
jgi:NTP pyrophosphatase (non-canonical NTP hydrolase)